MDLKWFFFGCGPSLKLGKVIFTSAVDSHWFQRGSEASFVSQCGFGSWEPNQCGSGFRSDFNAKYRYLKQTIGTKDFLTGRKLVLFPLILINFHALGSRFGSAFPIRIRTQDSQSMRIRINNTCFLQGALDGRAPDSFIIWKVGYITWLAIGRNYGLEKKQLWDMRDLIGEVRRSLELVGVAPLPHQARPAHLHLLLRLAIFAAFYPNYYVQVTSITRVPRFCGYDFSDS
jgi:hypothetical protein